MVTWAGPVKRSGLICGLLAVVAFGLALVCLLAYAQNASFSVAAGGGPRYVATAERLTIWMLGLVAAGLALTAFSVVQWLRNRSH